MTRQRSRLRWIVIGVSVALMLLSQLAAVAITGPAARQTALEVASDAIEREGQTTVATILRHLDPAQQSAEVTSRLIAADLLDLSEPGLERYLYTQLAVMPQMAGIFVGYPDGSFVHVARDDGGYRTKRITAEPERIVAVTHHDAEFVEISQETVGDDDYDPRTRPWYTLAIQNETSSVVWTEPYVFFTSGEPGVTAGLAVRGSDGTASAVVGVDVELSGLAAFIDELAVSANGEAFVVSGDTVVAAPSDYAEQSAVNEDGTLRLLTTDELAIDTLVDASPAEIRAVAVVDHQGERQLVNSTDFPDSSGLPWTAVIRAPQGDFTAALNQQQRALTLVWFVGAAVLALTALVMFGITRPLRRLQDAATIDHLTGVVNRRALAELGERLLIEARRRNDVTAVVVLDLDDFKAINDVHGHTVGDDALRAVGESLRELTRPGDVVGRLGGDEFVVVSAVHDTADAVALAERLTDGVSATLRGVHPDLAGLGASSGLCTTSGEADFDEMLHRADAALIVQKTSGKGRVGLCTALADEPV